MPRPTAPVLLAALSSLLATPATAATTRYSMDWSTSVSSGYTLDGVSVRTTLLGGASLYSTPTGPWIGSSAANDAEISFSKPIKEFCVYVWWNNFGEATTISTDRTSGNVFRAIDTGGVTTTVSGATFTWSTMATADIAAMCVANDLGISKIKYDHNGAGAGLVFGDSVLMDPNCTKRWYRDSDRDGYGDPRVSTTACSAPAGYVEDNTDCDDSRDSVHPGATEVPYDGIDQDCNGSDLCDVDLDGFVHPLCGGVDCDDDDDALNPRADETWYDGVDQDCDGWSDYDADRDGFDSDGYGGDDCDDDDEDIHPDADEIWYDDIDQDCDAASDFDVDGDGFDAVEYGGDDCDDDDVTVYPGAPELDDGIDNDCNGLTEDDDSDGDGIPDEDELGLGLDPYSDDSDGDGIPDLDELGDIDDPIDTDKDGTIDALDADDDGDGILTIDELGDDGPVDTDGDQVPDHLDLDSDDDGIDDAVETDTDTDGDGVGDWRDDDSDDDGVLDEAEVDGDTDKDGVVDRLDPDDDGDGFGTLEESSWASTDLDGDDIENRLDDDSDGDGILDADEGWGDDDCDGVPNVQDADDLDGPCLNPPARTYQSGACATGGPAPMSGIALVVLGLVGLVRRRRHGRR